MLLWLLLLGQLLRQLLGELFELVVDAQFSAKVIRLLTLEGDWSRVESSRWLDVAFTGLR